MKYLTIGMIYTDPQLLDNGEITEDPDTTKGKPRKKPLPATYEPGWFYKFIVASCIYCGVDRQTDLSMAQTEKGLCSRRR